MRRTKRSTGGQGIIEAVGAAFILIPIALCLLDLIVIVMANQINDQAAKNAARAAANQQDLPHAKDAANTALQAFNQSSIMKGPPSLTDIQYTKDDVSVETTINVKLPVPFPGYSDVKFAAKDVEPVLYTSTK